MVEQLSASDGRLGLWDELRAAHVLSIPVGRAVEGEFGTLLRASVCGVLVVWREVYIF